VKKKSSRSPTRRSAKRPAAKPLPERRQMRGLRELLDELIGHVRDTSRRADDMGPSELKYAQERLQWLVDEVWRLVLEGGDETL
jgi:hypothetical protein